jgi:hypothetical protein
MMTNNFLLFIGFGMQELLIVVAIVALPIIVLSIYRRMKGDAAADSLMNIIMGGAVVWCIIATIWLVIT